MVKKINMFMVDDHPIILEAYENILGSYEPSKYEISISKAFSCKDGYHTIVNLADERHFDIIFLDISMPFYEEKEILSGEDLAIKTKEIMPLCKIVLITMYTEIFRLSNILKTINPDGLLIKNDLTSEEFIIAFQKIISGETYFSKTVLNFNWQSPYNTYVLDRYDRQIIYHLSKGVKTKNMPQHIFLSLSAIEKRKALIKDLFKVRGGSDEDIIREAKNKGFL